MESVGSPPRWPPVTPAFFSATGPPWRRIHPPRPKHLFVGDNDFTGSRIPPCVVRLLRDSFCSSMPFLSAFPHPHCSDSSCLFRSFKDECFLFFTGVRPSNPRHHLSPGARPGFPFRLASLPVSFRPYSTTAPSWQFPRPLRHQAPPRHRLRLPLVYRFTVPPLWGFAILFPVRTFGGGGFLPFLILYAGGVAHVGDGRGAWWWHPLFFGPVVTPPRSQVRSVVQFFPSSK